MRLSWSCMLATCLVCCVLCRDYPAEHGRPSNLRPTSARTSKLQSTSAAISPKALNRFARLREVQGSWARTDCEIVHPGSPRANSEIDFTLVTQLSTARLGQVPELCTRWPGPIVFVIFFHSDQPVPTKPACSNERSTFVFHRATALEQELYPVNLLRNEALEHVTTSHLMTIDVDLWPSSTLYSRLVFLARGSTESNRLTFRRSRSALVVPVFEYVGQAASFSNVSHCDDTYVAGTLDEQCSSSARYRAVVPSSVQELKTCAYHKKCKIFDSTNPPAHSTTKYGEWTKQAHDHIRPIKCFSSMRYEPYVVLPRCDVPPFDERFTGYGKNKIQHVQHLRYLNFSFSVLPREFLIHVPHTPSHDRKKWQQQKPSGSGLSSSSELRMRMDRLYTKFLIELKMAYGSPQPLCQFQQRSTKNSIVRQVHKKALNNGGPATGALRHQFAAAVG